MNQHPPALAFDHYINTLLVVRRLGEQRKGFKRTSIVEQDRRYDCYWQSNDYDPDPSVRLLNQLFLHSTYTASAQHPTGSRTFVRHTCIWPVAPSETKDEGSHRGIGDEVAGVMVLCVAVGRPQLTF